MRKVLLFAVVVFFCFSAFAQDQDFSKVQIKVTKIAGSVYMLEGAGGNIAVSVGDDGIVVVDDQEAPLAEKIQAALKGITDKPVRFVINTHYHGDHIGGNAFFQQHSPVIAQDNVRRRLQSGGVGGIGGNGMSFEVKPSDAKTLPILTFDHQVTIHLNGEDVRVLHLPTGHTDGDSVVFFTKSNVLHMGDDFVTYGFPFIDISAGGSVRGLVADFDELIPKLPADVKIIPGHGPLSTLDDLKAFQAMLKDSVAAVEKGMKEGKTVEQMKQAGILARWKKLDGGYIKGESWIQTVYNDLSSAKSSKLMKHN